MTKEIAIEIKDLSKLYQLGEIGSKSFFKELKGIFRKKEINIGVNDRSVSQEKETHVWAMKNLNLSINTGEVVGIIGKNGAGKSTLLKLLSRITSPSTGQITLNGRVGALLEVGTGFQPDLTGRENIYLNGAILGMSKKEINEKLNEIIAFSGCAKYIDTPVKRYSSGMSVRLGFSVAAHLEPEILIIDEVLAVGDQDFQDQCVKKMKQFAKNGKTVLFVSHNMASVKSLCTRGIVLEKGEMAYDGSIDDAIQFYLSKQEKSESGGVVPLTAGDIKSEVCRFTKIIVKGENKKVANSLLYGENLEIYFEIESVTDMPVNIEFVLNSQDNYPLASLNNVFDLKPINLKVGMNKFSLSVNMPVNPGTYSLTPAIAETNGTSLHYLPNYIDLKVENVPLDASKPYPFVWINSPLKLKSSWQELT